MISVFRRYSTDRKPSVVLFASTASAIARFVHGPNTTKAGMVANRDVARRASVLTAYVLSASLAILMPGSHSITIGFLLAVLVSPMLISLVARMSFGRLLMRSAIFVAITAPYLVLTTLSLDPFRSFSLTDATTAAVLLLGFVYQVVAVAWASSVLGVVRVAILYSAGDIFNASVHPQLWSINPWKYAFAWSVSVFVIAVTSRSPRFLQSIGIVLVALFALTHESRNSGGILLL